MSIDLTTRYGGLVLKSPIIVGACQLTAEEMLRIAMISAGAGALVLPSLQEDQVILWNEQHGHGVDPSLEAVTDNEQVFEAAHRWPVETSWENVAGYLELVQRVSCQNTIPVVASLNGQCKVHWLAIAQALQLAGASAIELHLNHASPSQYASPREMENELIETARQIREVLEIPLFLKLGRDYTSICHLVERLHSTVQGVVLFGQSSEVDISLDSLQVTNRWRLSYAGSISNSLASILSVRNCCPVMSLAASGGIGSSSDLIKALLVGADVAMITSAVYRDGPTVIGTMLEGLIRFMESHKLTNLSELTTKCRLQFEADHDRFADVKSTATQFESASVRCANRVMESDPWGHPRAPR